MLFHVIAAHLLIAYEDLGKDLDCFWWYVLLPVIRNTAVLFDEARLGLRYEEMYPVFYFGCFDLFDDCLFDDFPPVHSGCLSNLPLVKLYRRWPALVLLTLHNSDLLVKQT